MAILEIQNIMKSYGDFKAVHDISFTVQTGRIYGILGPNGAGKTTTIRMAMNILLPDEGNILLFGQQMRDELKSRIGYLPEERGLYPKMKVLDMLIFLGELHGLNVKTARQRSLDWMKELDLADWSDKKVEELSKGMQQKIQFIGTIMHEPELLIFDEPFSGLDPINTQILKNIMVRLRDENKAIMFSTHMMDAAEKLCDDILLINKGQKILDGELAEIKQEHGANSVQIEFDGDGEFIQQLPFVNRFDTYSNYIEVRLKDGTDPDDLLKAIVGKVHIRRFQITESSLHDIFIEIVGDDNHE